MSLFSSRFVKFPHEITRICLMCKVDKPVKEFTNAGVTRAKVCDLCLSNWHNEQIARGNTGKT